MNLKTLKFLLVGLWLFNSIHANALESDRQQPLKIVADSAVINEKDGEAVYSGNVVLTQGTLKIIADELRIKTLQGKVDIVMAKGTPALFTQIPEPNQSEVIAKAKSIDYHVREQHLLLKRSASIVQQENIFRGEEILYEIQTQRLQALGQTADPQPGDTKGRVEMILPAAAKEATAPQPPKSTPGTEINE